MGFLRVLYPYFYRFRVPTTSIELNKGNEIHRYFVSSYVSLRIFHDFALKKNDSIYSGDKKRSPYVNFIRSFMQRKNFGALFAPLMLLPATFLSGQAPIKSSVTNHIDNLSDSRGSGRNVSIDLGQQPQIEMAHRGSGRNIAHRGSGRNVVAHRGSGRNVA
jgi:hypothetical protein